MSSGNSSQLDQWLPRIYDELRRMASGFLARERRAHTLRPSDLVNEACLRLARQRQGFNSPTHLAAIAATAMRRILVDHARRFRSAKHGGEWQRITFARLSDAGVPKELDLETFLDLDAALSRLGELDPTAAQIVELRFFGGLGMAEIATEVGRPKRSIEREWTHARSWLMAEMSNPPSGPTSRLGDSGRGSGCLAERLHEGFRR